MAARSTYPFLALLVLSVLASGCVPSQADNAPEPKKKNTGIIGKKTQDIGEAKPGAKQADLKGKPGSYTSALTGGVLQSYKTIADMQIKPLIEMYRVEHEEYPKDHETFMRDIIKANNIQLPVLPGGRQYQYDVENHVLIVVDAENAN